MGGKNSKKKHKDDTDMASQANASRASASSGAAHPQQGAAADHGLPAPVPGMIRVRIRSETGTAHGVLVIDPQITIDKVKEEMKSSGICAYNHDVTSVRHGKSVVQANTSLKDAGVGDGDILMVTTTHNETLAPSEEYTVLSVETTKPLIVIEDDDL